MKSNRLAIGLRQLLLFLLSFALFTGSLSVAQAVEQRLIDVVELNWAGSARPSVSTADLQTSLVKVRKDWLSFTTLEGGSNSSSIEYLYGAGLNQPLTLLSPFQCDATNFTSFVNSIRAEFYKRLGIRDAQDRYLIILVPNSGCIWSGRALIGDIKNKAGAMVLHNTASPFVITHELGHSLGLGHTNLLRCSSGASDGPWSNDCRAVEYGGSIDVMGNVDTTSPLSVYHQWRMGLLDNSEIYQSWLSEKVKLGASDRKSGIRAIFIRDGASSYWLEYRRPRADLNYKSGIAIYRSDPPASRYVESPNPIDEVDEFPNTGVAIDTWMLNLDTYSYSPTGRYTGSMTLPANTPVNLHSKNVKISFTKSSDENSVEVVIERTPDTSPPPKPVLSPPQFWQFPDFPALESGYEDGISEISYFEIKTDEEISRINPVFEREFLPTALSPFRERPTLRVRELPEGKYSLQIRAIDIWGNVSQWSDSRNTFIDRGAPIISSNFRVTSVDQSSAKISLTDFADPGSGLCETVLINPEGFIVARSASSKAPEIKLDSLSLSATKLQSFDCLGNGKEAPVSTSFEYITTDKIRTIGKWRSLPSIPGAITCPGNCVANLTADGNIQLALGSGSARFTLAKKELARISQSSSNTLRLSDPLAIGANKRTIRIEGNNLVILGAVKVRFEVGRAKNISRLSHPEDLSLKEESQSNLINYGFKASDFEQGWYVLPMGGGTTLKDPTLDFCKSKYLSDEKRSQRRQVAVTKVGSPYIFLSSEVVRYESSLAAEAAYKELLETAKKCLSDGGGSEQGDVFTKYIFRPLPNTNAPYLLKEGAFYVQATIGEGAMARTLLAFYQFNRSTFTGLYVVTLGDKPFSENEINRWSDAAQLLLERLKASS